MKRLTFITLMISSTHYLNAHDQRFQYSSPLPPPALSKFNLDQLELCSFYPKSSLDKPQSRPDSPPSPLAMAPRRKQQRGRSTSPTPPTVPSPMLAEMPWWDSPVPFTPLGPHELGAHNMHMMTGDPQMPYYLAGPTTVPYFSTPTPSSVADRVATPRAPPTHDSGSMAPPTRATNLDCIDPALLNDESEPASFPIVTGGRKRGRPAGASQSRKKPKLEQTRTPLPAPSRRRGAPTVGGSESPEEPDLSATSSTDEAASPPETDLPASLSVGGQQSADTAMSSGASNTPTIPSSTQGTPSVSGTPGGSRGTRRGKGKGMHIPSVGEHRAQWHFNNKKLSDDSAADDHAYVSHSTAQSADIRLITFPVSAEEILTFFPRHTYWHDVSLRFKDHGWTPGTIAQFINWSRNITDERDVQRTTVHHQLKQAKKWLKNAQGSSHAAGTARSAIPSTYDSATGGHSGALGSMDYFLVDLAEGVDPDKFPKDGHGALALTAAINHAIQNDHEHEPLSNVVNYVMQHNLFNNNPHAAHNAAREDEAAADYHRVKIKKYCDRVFKGRS
ncbi:unnamed protein product [Periconia digitata]|uniref:Uncharacterized protein n=1 Tax=Periconia digitata TaxID=1303443 RepID=A0A9W4XSP6_9PLEO|nr:unnamed protein product [Periconia digitata]